MKTTQNTPPRLTDTWANSAAVNMQLAADTFDFPQIDYIESMRGKDHCPSDSILHFKNNSSRRVAIDAYYLNHLYETWRWGKPVYHMTTTEAANMHIRAGNGDTDACDQERRYFRDHGATTPEGRERRYILALEGDHWAARSHWDDLVSDCQDGTLEQRQRAADKFRAFRPIWEALNKIASYEEAKDLFVRLKLDPTRDIESLDRRLAHGYEATADARAVVATALRAARARRSATRVNTPRPR